jgi:glycine/D-amino acid oxidase-like deaminating enzyme
MQISTSSGAESLRSKPADVAAAPPAECDLAVVGGGIVGLAVARELTRRRPDLDAVVLERAPVLATGQTGANILVRLWRPADPASHVQHMR